MKQRSILSALACMGLMNLMTSLGCSSAPNYGSDKGPAAANANPNAETGTSGDASSGSSPDGKAVPAGGDADSGNAPLDLLCSKDNGSQSYVGLGGEKLEAGRVVQSAPQLDRYRLKTFEMLQDNYRLAFGELPRTLESYRQTFGQAEARWFLTPVPSAFTNHALFVLGREAAQSFLRKDRSWASRTGEEKVREGCTLFAQKVWKQVPGEEALAVCETYMLSPELAKLSPADRWSYGMAMMLSSIEFIAY